MNEQAFIALCAFILGVAVALVIGVLSIALNKTRCPYCQRKMPPEAHG